MNANHDDPADANDRDVMRQALGALERAAERFRAIVPTVPMSHLAALDLVADADHLVARLSRLTRAYQANANVDAALRAHDQEMQFTDAQLAAVASRYLGVDVTVETVDAADLAARAPAFPDRGQDDAE